MVVVLLVVVSVARSSVISSPNNHVDNTSIHASRSSSTVPNITIDCGDWGVLNTIIWQCERELVQLAENGYPWSAKGSQRNPRHNLNITKRNNTLGDPLDSLNHVCHIYDRSQTCLEENYIGDYCLRRSTVSVTSLKSDFQFICNQPRNENLVHSLQCLYDSRLLAMLYFHIADRCHGMAILDDIMRRYKNAIFYIEDVNPFTGQGKLPVS